MRQGILSSELHYASQKTRTSFSKNMYVFPKKLVRVFLKAKTMIERLNGNNSS